MLLPRVLTFTMLLFPGVAPAPAKAQTSTATEPDPVVSDYFGTPVSDPHRHLENFDDPQVQAWLRRQADTASDTFATLPGRARLLGRIRELEQAAAFTVSQPQRLPDGDIFFLKQAADEDVARLWVREADTAPTACSSTPPRCPGQPPTSMWPSNALRHRPMAAMCSTHLPPTAPSKTPSACSTAGSAATCPI